MGNFVSFCVGMSSFWLFFEIPLSQQVRMVIDLLFSVWIPLTWPMGCVLFARASNIYCGEP